MKGFHILSVQLRKGSIPNVIFVYKYLVTICFVDCCLNEIDRKLEFRSYHLSFNIICKIVIIS